jgi:hypothetical protein
MLKNRKTLYSFYILAMFLITATQTPLLGTKKIILSFKNINHQKNSDNKKRQKLLKKHNYIAGISGFYGGTKKFSNRNGQLIFSKKHKSKEFTLIFSENIKAHKAHKNAIAGLKTTGNAEEEHYKAFLIKKHLEKNGNSFWEVEKAKIKENGLLSRSSIIINIDPTSAFIRIGKHYKKNELNVLPEILINFDQKKIDLSILKNLDLYSEQPQEVKGNAPGILIETSGG